MKTNTRGGKRTGAGRKPNPTPTKPLGIRVTEEEKAILTKMLEDIRSGFIEVRYGVYSIQIKPDKEFNTLAEANQYIADNNLTTYQLCALPYAGYTQITLATLEYIE